MKPGESVADVMTVADVAALPAVVDLMTAAQVLRIGRTTAYALAREDGFPCPLLLVGGEYRVPVVGVLRVLGIDPPIG